MSKKQLICFDWDGTLSQGHSHNIALMSDISKRSVEDGIIVNGKVLDSSIINIKHDTMQEINFARGYYIDGKNKFNNADQILDTIRTLLNLGRYVAITSYNSFPEIINQGLVIIGFCAEEIAKINVICGLPAKGNEIFSGKTPLITEAKKLLDINDNAYVTLVDDSPRNIRDAEAEGITTLHVTFHNRTKFMLEIKKKILSASEYSVTEAGFSVFPSGLKYFTNEIIAGPSEGIAEVNCRGKDSFEVKEVTDFQ